MWFMLLAIGFSVAIVVVVVSVPIKTLGWSKHPMRGKRLPFGSSVKSNTTFFCKTCRMWLPECTFRFHKRLLEKNAETYQYIQIKDLKVVIRVMLASKSEALQEVLHVQMTTKKTCGKILDNQTWITNYHLLFFFYIPTECWFERTAFAIIYTPPNIKFQKFLLKKQSQSLFPMNFNYSKAVGLYRW